MTSMKIITTGGGIRMYTMVWGGDPTIIHGMTRGTIPGIMVAGTAGIAPGITADGILRGIMAGTARGITVGGTLHGTMVVGMIPGIMVDIGAAAVITKAFMTAITAV